MKSDGTRTHSEVDTGDSVHDDEDIGVGELGEAEVEADGEHEDQQLQVEVEGRPRGRLVLGNRGDDGDIVLSVGGVQQRVETSGPRGDFWWWGQGSSGVWWCFSEFWLWNMVVSRRPGFSVFTPTHFACLQQ